MNLVDSVGNSVSRVQFDGVKLGGSNGGGSIGVCSDTGVCICAGVCADGTSNRENVGVGNGSGSISTNGTISQTSGDTSIGQRSDGSSDCGKGKGCGSLQDFGVSGSLSVR